MVQIPKSNSRPKERREPIQPFFDNVFVFDLRVTLLRVKTAICHRRNPTPRVAKNHFIERYVVVYVRFAEAHERSVDNNASEPGGKTRSALE